MAENFYGITDTGKMRDNNEDAFIAENVLHDRYIAACVIDGVGGYEGGEIAATLAREAILDHLKDPFEDVTGTLKKSFVAANEKIYKEKHITGQNGQMACVLTLALADISENKFYYAHVGDTRLYLFRDDSLVKVTHDHSFVGFLEDSGRLSEEAAMHHPKRNEINKALGFDQVEFSQPGYIETGESPFLPGDIILLCSDGLSDMLSNKVITSILSSDQSLKDKCRSLIGAANDAGGKDNITVVLVENDKLRPSLTATRPAAKKKEVQEQEPAVRNEPEIPVDDTEEIQPRGRRSAVVILAILLFLSLAALSWFVYHDYLRKPKAVMPAPATVHNVDTAGIKLSDSINRPVAKEIYLSRIFSQPIYLHDSIAITRDSLTIHGGGIKIIADSNYRGAAFMLPQNCKYILIDSLVLENFATGFIVHNTALHLKNVRFTNCDIPVAHQIHLPNDKSVSGKLEDGSFSYPDSQQVKH
ncbi:MAG TPA: protein phosphatase 2C domain-containing protein [Parafilimonas sp.]|nr:protein phosphatase 2C domain-containing protein [Parafilimonas sp.]